MLASGFFSLSYAQTSPPSVGGDRDIHGCIGSAGYTWSALKKECIRIFDGIALEPQIEALKNGTVAYLIMKPNSDAKVEVFVPGSAKGILMNKVKKPNSAGTWKGGAFTLNYWKGMYMLERNKKVLYQGMAN